MMLGTAITWNVLALMKLLPSHSNLHYCDIAGIKIVIILMTEYWIDGTFPERDVYFCLLEPR